MSRSRLLLLSLLVAGSAAAEQPLPVYPGAVHTRIGNDLLIGGQYHRLAYFVTSDAPRKVAQHFLSAWQEEGIPTTLNADGNREVVVSGFYTREGLQRSVVLVQHEGRTLGFTVLKDLWLLKPPPADTLVTVEGALFSQDVSARDEGGRTWQRTLAVHGTLHEVRGRVVAWLEEAGYRAAREAGVRRDGRQQLTLEHTRQGEQVITVLSEVEKGLVAVLQTWVGSDRPDAIPNADALRERRARQAEVRP